MSHANAAAGGQPAQAAEPSDRLDTAAGLPRRSLVAWGVAAAALPGCADFGTGMAEAATGPVLKPASLPPQAMPPAAPREFRGAWVATVANIDWPSKPGLSSEQQQGEMRRALDTARAVGLNAIVLQVRPAADALYASRLEPWSEYLTGTQGEAPQPWYDPLAHWVREAHRRGLELHAWFNPYRARHPSARSPAAGSHVWRRKPQLVREYGNLQWLDPGEPEAAEHTLAVVADVLRRYDIDGVHIDDYFYPYPIPQPAPAGAPPEAAADGSAPAAPRPDLPFPDDAPFQRYVERGGRLARDDWRRDNVNRLIEALHASVRRIKPQVRLGISPFGLGKPELRPEGIEGFSQYDRLYADVELWVKKGWFDYLAPQLYWPIERRGQAFPLLLDYWAAQVALSEAAPRHHWPGLFTSSVGRSQGGGRGWPVAELLNQITLLRTRGSGAASGHIHFSLAALLQDREGIATQLRQGPYRDDALAPASPWLEARPPAPPFVHSAAGRLRLQPGPGEAPLLWALWRREAASGNWRFATVPASERQVPLLGADAVVLSAVARSGLESERQAFAAVA